MTYFFYDIETSGLNSRTDRIMQFAGQRTDLNFKCLGQPINRLIKLNPDVIPDPQALMIHRITPQKTLKTGMTEADFLKFFNQQIVRPNTIFLGYNSIKFDDEFMRFLHYRNFCNPYDWQSSQGSSRWDLINVVRMTRALRPDGIKWPVDNDGKSSNRLECLTKKNGISHQSAHDALDDVRATISLASLINTKQPKLFNYLKSIRGKDAIKIITDSNQPFVFTDSSYSTTFDQTTIVMSLGQTSKKNGVLVYDLRCDPSDFIDLSAEELFELWPSHSAINSLPTLPVKFLKYNQCPALAPMSVIDAASQKRLSLNFDVINQNLELLKQSSGLAANILKAFQIFELRQQVEWKDQTQEVDTRLYDNFFDDYDTRLMDSMRQSEPGKLSDFINKFHDQRLKELLPIYKARNYPDSLTTQEKIDWQNYCRARLSQDNNNGGVESYLKTIEDCLSASSLTRPNKLILEDMRSYALSLMDEKLKL